MDNETHGVKLCRDAFNRLLIGKANNESLADLQLSKITPAIVCLEAGFDKGYLKKDREIHANLLRDIKSHRDQHSKANSASHEIEKLKRKERRNQESIALLEKQLAQSLIQNIQLVRKVKIFEMNNANVVQIKR